APGAGARRELSAFGSPELQAREPQCPAIRPVRVLLANQRDDLLAFVVALDRDIAALAEQFAIGPTQVRALLNVQTLDEGDPQRWQQEILLRQQVGERATRLLPSAVAAR